MPRATNAPASRRRRKRMLKHAKGYFGNKSKLYRYAKEAVHHAWQKAYISRRLKKRDWRRLWTVRINAACRLNGITYSRFIEGLAAAGVGLDRKMLADIAVRDEEGFKKIVEQARTALAAKSTAAAAPAA
jgi:large subunit ribosomal protein L20